MGKRNCISQFKTALEQPAFVMDKYLGLLQIMSEEAEKYFAGDKSTEEVAEAIQPRANIYLAEKQEG